MPYIPEKHIQYNLLPNSRRRGGEVFSYPCNLLDEVNKILPKGESLYPYGYVSYEEYYDELDEWIEFFSEDDYKVNLIRKYKELVRKKNIKEEWSVVKYCGEDSEGILGLLQGRCYYWPCRAERPIYEGVIDEEEFTSYEYSTAAELWEIIDDPTGMAYATIYLHSVKKS